MLKIFKKNSYLKAIVDSVLSQDVAKKLFESSHFLDQSDNGPTQSLYSKNGKLVYVFKLMQNDDH